MDKNMDKDTDTIVVTPVEWGGVSVIINSFRNELTADQAEDLGDRLIAAAKQSRLDDETTK